MKSIIESNNNSRAVLDSMLAGLLQGICSPIVALYRQGDIESAKQLYADKVAQHESTYPTIAYDMSKYITRNL